MKPLCFGKSRELCVYSKHTAVQTDTSLKSGLTCSWQLRVLLCGEMQSCEVHPCVHTEATKKSPNATWVSPAWASWHLWVLVYFLVHPETFYCCRHFRGPHGAAAETPGQKLYFGMLEGGELIPRRECFNLTAVSSPGLIFSHFLIICTCTCFNKSTDLYKTFD